MRLCYDAFGFQFEIVPVACMAKAPVVHELEFLKLTRNHGEFCQKLTSLGHPAAAADLVENAHYIGLNWLELADEHMKDGRLAAGAVAIAPRTHVHTMRRTAHRNRFGTL
jgi:hypothetical protein